MTDDPSSNVGGAYASRQEVTTCAGSMRAMTGFTETEFQTFPPPFEAAFDAYMRGHTADGQPRASRSWRRAPIPCGSI
jgi:hypothetical protein